MSQATTLQLIQGASTSSVFILLKTKATVAAWCCLHSGLYLLCCSSPKGRLQRADAALRAGGRNAQCPSAQAEPETGGEQGWGRLWVAPV